MKKVIFIILFLFVFSVFSTNIIMAKDTTKTLKKIVKKSDKKVKDPTVYIRKKGKKYHKKNCKLVKEKIGIKLSKAKKEGYEPCKICFPPKKAKDKKDIKKIVKSKRKK